MYFHLLAFISNTQIQKLVFKNIHSNRPTLIIQNTLPILQFSDMYLKYFASDPSSADQAITDVVWSIA